MRPISEIRGYQPVVNTWDLDYTLIEKEEGRTSFSMVEGEVYTAPAFFNPVMILNRDFSILFSALLSRRQERPLRVFEPLGGIGVRAFRLVNEIPEAIKSVVINDFGDVSTRLASFNRSKFDHEKIVQFKREARSLASELGEEQYKFQMIDLDPFGPPTPFLDSLWRITQNHGVISVTATDMQALAGVYPESCLRKYGGLPFNNFHTHETAARILIAAVIRSAARFDKGVRPVFTLSSHHYIKIFFEISDGRGRANELVKQIQDAATCKVCQRHRFLDANTHWECCDVQVYGPLWSGPLFSNDWCNDALELLEEIELPSHRAMSKFLEEGTKENIPFYYAIEFLASRLGTNSPKLESLIERIENEGYVAYKTRFRRNALRTNAPMEVIEQSMRALSIK